MNILDIFIIIVLAYCLIMGVFRGTLREAVSIAGVLCGYFAAYNLYMALESYIPKKWMSDAAYRDILSFFLIFFLIFILFSLLGMIIRYLLKKADLTLPDRISGAGFGAVKGVLIVSVILFALVAFLKKESPLIQDSRFAPRIMIISEQMSMPVKQEMKTSFTTKMNDFRKSWNAREKAEKPQAVGVRETYIACRG